MANRILPPQAYLCECFSYDPETGEFLWIARPEVHFKTIRACRSFNTRLAGKRAGWPHAKTGGRLYVRLDNRGWGVSRIVWKMVTGDDPPHMVDHRDRDPSNNRWLNLRLATDAQNVRNKSASSNHLKGAYPTPEGRWNAKIGIDYQSIYLGSFDTEIEAHAAYVSASQRLHGDFGSSG